MGGVNYPRHILASVQDRNEISTANPTPIFGVGQFSIIELAEPKNGRGLAVAISFLCHVDSEIQLA